MGVTAGGAIGQMRGAHIGRMSIELVQTGVALPLTQLHWHDASALPAPPKKAARAITAVLYRT